MRGEVDFGDYFEHLLSWAAVAAAPNLLFITYEEMKADVRAVIAAVAGFLGEKAESTVRNEAVLTRILDAVSFESMARDQGRWSSARPKDQPAFVRKGAVGDWQNLMTSAQARRLLAVFEERTAGTSAARLWPDIIAAARRHSS
jgi:hypothetical protein